MTPWLDTGTRYRTIVADPPWPYDEGFATMRGSCTRAEVKAGWRESVTRRNTPLGYMAMTLEQIAELPIPDLAYRRCRLFLWSTQRHMPIAYGLLDVWGFRYKQTLIWRKTSSFSPFGGSLAPNNVEFVIVGVRGVPAVKGRRVEGCVFDIPGNSGRRKANGAGPNKHSRKPEAFLDFVEQVSPGPYLELFARRQRLGWDTWGDEALEHVEIPS